MARSASGRARGRSGRSGLRGRSQSPGWGWEFLVRPEHNRFWLVVGFVVRRRAELTVITVSWLVFVQLESHVTPDLPEWMTPAQWAWLLLAATAAVVLAVPVSRRYTVRRCTAVVMRHRMRACFLQTRTWTANGRLPFLVWSRPTRVGVRVRVWLPAGLSVNDLERIIDELGAACWAREARITTVRGQAALVLVDIVRRDPLGGSLPLTPPVVDHLDPHGHPTSGVNGVRPAWIATPPVQPPDLPIPDPRPAATIPPAAGNGRVNTSKGTAARGTSPGAQAEPPGMTGFGGVDVTDYV
jgi:hypothetical protein